MPIVADRQICSDNPGRAEGFVEAAVDEESRNLEIPTGRGVLVVSSRHDLSIGLQGDAIRPAAVRDNGSGSAETGVQTAVVEQPRHQKTVWVGGIQSAADDDLAVRLHSYAGSPSLASTVEKYLSIAVESGVQRTVLRLVPDHREMVARPAHRHNILVAVQSDGPRCIPAIQRGDDQAVGPKLRIGSAVGLVPRQGKGTAVPARWRRLPCGYDLAVRRNRESIALV